MGCMWRRAARRLDSHKWALVSRAPPTDSIGALRDFCDKVVFANHLPADDDVNAAVYDFGIKVEQGFGLTSNFI